MVDLKNGFLPVDGDGNINIEEVETGLLVKQEMKLEDLSKEQREVYDILIGRMSNKKPVEPTHANGDVDVTSEEYRLYTQALMAHEDEKYRILNSMQVRIADLGSDIPVGKFASLISIANAGFIKPSSDDFIVGLIECHRDEEIDDETFISNLNAYVINCFVQNVPIKYPQNHSLMKKLLVGPEAQVSNWITAYLDELKIDLTEQLRLRDNVEGTNPEGGVADETVIKEISAILESDHVAKFLEGHKTYNLAMLDSDLISSPVKAEEVANVGGEEFEIKKEKSFGDDGNEEEYIPNYGEEDDEEEDNKGFVDIKNEGSDDESDWVGFDDENEDEVEDEEIDDLVTRIVTTIPVANENGVSNEKHFIKQINNRTAKVKTKTITVEDFASSNSVVSMINREKEKRYGSVTIPLVHSGFNISYVAANTVQFKKMYSADPTNIKISDHLNRLKLMASSIIGTDPKVEPSKLLESISQADLTLATFGHTAAACPKLQYPVTCDNVLESGKKCDEPFVIESRTIDTLLNADELIEKWEKVSQLPMDERQFKKIIEVEFKCGLELVLEMPNLKTLKKSLQSVKDAIGARKVTNQIQSSIVFLPFIKEARFGDIIALDSPSIYILMEETIDPYEMEIVIDGIKDLQENVFEPKFGFRGTCPKCGHEHTIEVTSISDVVFYHCWIEERRWDHEQQQKRKEKELKDGKDGETLS